MALVAVNAPAFAASTSCLTAKWTEAVYSGANGTWSLCFDFVNCGTAEIKVTKVDVFTTYQAPATNTTADQLVDTIMMNTTVGTDATALNPVKFCSSKTPFDTPPVKSGANLLPEYYNDFLPADTDGQIDCVAKTGSPVFPANPLYPDSCKQLRADGTYVVITYTISGGTQTVYLPMDDNVGCRVTAGCTS